MSKQVAMTMWDQVSDQFHVSIFCKELISTRQNMYCKQIFPQNFYLEFILSFCLSKALFFPCVIANLAYQLLSNIGPQGM
jgi:hypothetical protein